MTFAALLFVGVVAQMSPLQALVAATPSGGTLRVEAGTYTGDLILDKPIHVIGIGMPRLVGSGRGTVVSVRADDVTIEGFAIDGRNGGRLEDDSAGVHVRGHRAVIRHLDIRRTLVGVYLMEADAATVEGVTVTGTRGKDPGEQGSGIHIFNTLGFELRRNVVRDSRDGFYLQNASRGRVIGNSASDVRYGLHYMYSDDNVFEDNTFERSAAGAALMYSARIQFRRNRFLHNRGFTSVGLLMQGCDDVLAEHNLIVDNGRGIFLEGTARDVFRGNVIADSDAAVVLYGSSTGTRFESNVFAGNLSPLQLVGRRTDAVFDGNYWDAAREPDLDADGVRDRPYKVSNVFDHMRGNLAAADLFAQGWGASALARAEEIFPVLDPAVVVDAHPLVRQPALPEVPAVTTAHQTSAAGAVVSLLVALLGASTWRGARLTARA